MTYRNLFPLCILVLIFSCGERVEESQEQTAKPNIVFILADDLGYGEVGYQGQDIIKTPNIDALANSGRVFTNHYSGAPVCAPARCIFLTGKHGGHAYIRGNDGMTERGDVWDYALASADPNLEGQRPLPASTQTLAKLLQSAGYETGIVGKWGLGGPMTEGIPSNLGFDYFYGYNCQRQAHNLYPPHLWENETKIPLDNEIVVPRTLLDSLADPNNPASYTRYEQNDYAPDLMHDKALAFMETNKDEPFFLYYASPLPHVPLQIPDADRQAYIEEFGAEMPYDGLAGYFPNQFPRATYAAMITKLDQQIGELRDKLEELGVLENTLIVVTSDNGPTFLGGVDFDYFESSEPFTNGYGRTKGFVYEGGVRVPMLVNWKGKIDPGTSSDHISIFYDWLPTICEMIGIEVPMDADGQSFFGAIMGTEQLDRDYIFWEYPEYGGQQAIRMGDWKAVRQNIKKEGNLEIELYNLAEDPEEQQNVANKNPTIVKEMELIFQKEHEKPAVDTFLMPALDIK